MGMRVRGQLLSAGPNTGNLRCRLCRAVVLPFALRTLRCGTDLRRAVIDGHPSSSRWILGPRQVFYYIRVDVRIVPM